MSFAARTFTGLGGGSDPTYWIMTFVNSSHGWVNDIALDSGGNIIVGGKVGTAAAGQDGYLAKFTNKAVPIWQKFITGVSGASTEQAISSVAIDSSDNVYCGTTGVGSTSTVETLVYKFNSSGVHQAFSSFGRNTSPTLDSVNLIVSGSPAVVYYACSVTGTILGKLNSDMSQAWQRYINVTGLGVAAVAIDSSSNLYLVNGHVVSSTYRGMIFKYNSSGVLQAQTALGGLNTAVNRFDSITIASDGSIYVSGYTQQQGFGQYDAILAKYNSSLVLQWQRIIGSTGSDAFTGPCNTISIDPAGDIYICGNDAASSAGFIAKYNSSGTLLWQRKLSASQQVQFHAIATDSTSVIVAGWYYDAGSVFNGIVARLPSDGSLTGTYGGFTYAAGGMSTVTPTLATSTPTITDSALTFTTSNWGTAVDSSYSGTPTSSVTTVL